MALKRFEIKGYGQLELNQAPFRRSGRIEAQCKIADGIDYIENGMLLAVNRKTHTVGYPTGDANEVIALNYTTEHMYDERTRGLKYFKLDKNTFLPRLDYIRTPDKFTTNTVCYDDAAEIDTYAYGKACSTEGFEGYIELTNDREGAYVEVLAVTTMPDGQKAVKFAGLN
jgi:hypothetical protein